MKRKSRLANIFRKPRAGAVRLAFYVLGFTGAALALNAWIVSSGAIEWSRSLASPAWAPPGPVVGIVWVVLFALMGLAAFVVDRYGVEQRKDAARLAILCQFALNMGWTWGYFGLQSTANGFYVTVAALLLSIAVLVLSWRAARLAGLLIAPLLVWLAFALVLSWSVWRLNA